jgi:2,4'-dihydroxyacetophenone dioxygenase
LARLKPIEGYEAPGEAHTLVAYESDEPMKVHFNVTGPLVWLGDIELCRDHYEQVGIGADYVDKLFR